MLQNISINGSFHHTTCSNLQLWYCKVQLHIWEPARKGINFTLVQIVSYLSATKSCYIVLSFTGSEPQGLLWHAHSCNKVHIYTYKYSIHQHLNKCMLQLKNKIWVTNWIHIFHIECIFGFFGFCNLTDWMTRTINTATKDYKYSRNKDIVILF